MPRIHFFDFKSCSDTILSVCFTIIYQTFQISICPITEMNLLLCVSADGSAGVNVPKDAPAIQTISSPSIIHIAPVSCHLHHCALKLLLALSKSLHCNQKFPLSIASHSKETFPAVIQKM